MIDAADPIASDKRQTLRTRALLGGKLAYGEGFFTLDCLVRDLSTSGARVKVPEGLGVPQVIYFLELRSGAVYEAKVVWRRHPEIGLQFTKVCSLDDPDNADLKILKRLWAESQHRSGVTT